MKRSLFILAVLFASLIAIAGFNTNAMAEQNTATKDVMAQDADVNQAVFANGVGYISVTIAEGEALFFYDHPMMGRTQVALCNQSMLLEAQAGSYFEIQCIPRWVIAEYSAPSSQVVANDTINVYAKLRWID